MHRFGPFSTQRRSNMELLGGILKVLLPYAAAFDPPSPTPSPDSKPTATGGSPARSSPRSDPQQRGQPRNPSPHTPATQRVADLSLDDTRSSQGSRSASPSPSVAARARNNQPVPGTGQSANIPVTSGPASGAQAMQSGQQAAVPHRGSANTQGGLQPSQPVTQQGGQGLGRGDPAVRGGPVVPRGRGRGGRARGG